jgi:hypothetical protein
MGCCVTISEHGQAAISLNLEIEDHTSSPQIPAQPQASEDKLSEITTVSRSRVSSVMGYNDSIQKEFQKKRESMLSNMNKT